MSTLALVVGLLGLAVAVVALAVAAGTAARLERLEARRLPERIGLSPGSSISADVFSGLVADDQADALVRGPSLVLFVSPQCAPCRDLVEDSPAELAPGWALVAIEPDGTTATDSTRNRGHLTGLWLVDVGSRVRVAFDTTATPHAFFVRDGRVVDQIVGAGVDEVRTHLASLTAPAPAL